MRLIKKKTTTEGAASPEETTKQAKKKRRPTKDRTTISGFDFTDEEARVYSDFANDPELAKKYELFAAHSDSKEAKRAATRRKVLLGAGGTAFAILTLRACNAGRVAAPAVEVGITSDEAAARAYAAKFTRDWYTWNAELRDERKERLAQYNPTFSNNEGWDGKGVQTVTNSWATTSEKTSDTTYAVTTCNIIDGSIQPLYAEVNIYAKDGATTILSYPNLVAAEELPITGMRNENRNVLTDKAVQEEISRRIGVFFRAWGQGDTATLESVCVSGFTVNPILSGHSYSAMSETSYYAPRDEEENAGTIVWVVTNVTWARAESTMQSTYEVTFTQENGKWLISDLNAATLYDKAVVTGATG